MTTFHNIVLRCKKQYPNGSKELISMLVKIKLNNTPQLMQV